MLEIGYEGLDCNKQAQDELLWWAVMKLGLVMS